MKNAALAITAPVAAALFAIVIVSAWILWRADSTPVGEAFTSTPEFLFWLLVLGAQAAVWFVALPYVVGTVWRRARSLHSAGTLDVLSLASLGVAALVLITTAVSFTLASVIIVGNSPRHLPTGDAWPLPDHTLKVQPLVGFALLVGVLAVIGIWIAGAAVTEISRDTGTVKSARFRDTSALDLTRFVELRNEINTLLAIAGVIIGFGTLASGLLREAVLATNQIELDQPPPPDTQPYVRLNDDPATPNTDESGYRLDLEFDSQYVALYGLFFTVLLAVAFAPSFLALRTAGRNLRDCALPLPAPTDSSFDDIRRKRKALDEFLQTGMSALASFKAGIAILSPLAGSLAALLLDLPT